MACYVSHMELNLKCRRQIFTCSSEFLSPFYVILFYFISRNIHLASPLDKKITPLSNQSLNGRRFSY